MRLRSRFGVGVALALVAAGSFAGGVSAQQPQPRVVRVTGQGRIAAPPDVAVLAIGATVLRDRPDEAFDRVESLIAALTARMRANGVAERDTITSDIGLTREFRTPPRAPDGSQPAAVFVGWRAQHFLSIRLRDFPRLGRDVSDAVATLEEAGEVRGISFAVENVDTLIEQARDAAARDARQKAERIAARLGFRLGGVVQVSETSATAPTARAATPSPAPAAFAAAPITGGDQVISVTLEVQFEIVQEP